MKKFSKSVEYALKGIQVAIRDERNIVIELVLACTVIVFGWVMGITTSDWIAIILSIGFVLVAELTNTAIEKFVDAVSPEKVPWAGTVKDIMAGAVLVASLISVIIAVLIFVPYFFTT